MMVCAQLAASETRTKPVGIWQLGILALFALVSGAVQASESDQGSVALEQAYPAKVLPLIAKYCADCHSESLAEADLNFDHFSKIAEVRRHPRVWQRVREMLKSGQMPPKDAPQLTADDQTALLGWVEEFLTYEARAHAGDPGLVILRRLNNVEYTNTIRDLTGLKSLEPAAEFPVDGAAGEGFTNTGGALVMSPGLLTKYLDAAKSVAAHAVLLPDGFTFGESPTPTDQTQERLEQIRNFYSRYCDNRVGEKVNLQGIIFNTNDGGGLPLDLYLVALVEERQSLTAGTKTTAEVARQRSLSPKYMDLLWKALNEPQQSLLLSQIQSQWKAADLKDSSTLVAEIAAWQRAVWKFSTVAHIGKIGGPKAWLEPISPLATHQDLKLTVPTSLDGKAVTLAMIARDVDGNTEQDVVIWEKPRLVSPGRPDILLRDIRQLTQGLAERRARIFGSTAECLDAVEVVAQDASHIADVARERKIDEQVLRSWLAFLGLGETPPELKGLFTGRLTKTGDYDFIQGWGSEPTPLLLTNSSDQHVRIPGNAFPHSVMVHPNPELAAGVAWRSPVTGHFRIDAHVQDAHPECGNGVSWALEVRRGKIRQQLAAGTSDGAAPIAVGPFDNVSVHKGELVVLLIGPRDGDHACDLTTIDLSLQSASDSSRSWKLSTDVAGNVLQGNPHQDSHGNPDVWAFFVEAQQKDPTRLPVPAGSLLAKWESATDPQEKKALAEQVEKLLTGPRPADGPDLALYQQLNSFDGPLFSTKEHLASNNDEQKNTEAWGLDPSLFGGTVNGVTIDPASLRVHAPAIVQFQLPPDLADKYELVVGAQLDPAGSEGAVQVELALGDPAAGLGIVSHAGPLSASAQKTLTPRIDSTRPILVREQGKTREKFEQAFENFRSLFPAALCYTKIVPVDEVVTLKLFYREDDQLRRLMLDEAETAELNRLWDELHYISQDAIAEVDVYLQLMEYLSQDADPSLFEHLRQPIYENAEAFRKQLIASEPSHLAHLMKFAEKAFRRPLKQSEIDEISQLYALLRKEELSHEDSFRLTLAKILVSPDFLYHVEIPPAGTAAKPVNDWELASRLSYFLWSSTPDEELLQLAREGKLSQPDVLLAQAHRMLKDERARRLATEFACAWLHVHGFDEHDEKSEAYFPTFAEMRHDMYEETILFFQDLFANNGSVLDILDADYTFLNERLANHYGIPGVTGEEWRKVENVKAFNRGGILAHATTLSKQSGASRTSPILRGNWISESLLGERLPRPPPGIPPLPDDPSAFAGLTMRQIVEKHSSDAKCAVCHQRIDPMGFSLEAFDGIGRHRIREEGDQPLNVAVTTMEGVSFTGLEGLREYLLTVRKEAFLRQFSKKLLGYALCRSVELSDETLLAQIRSDLETNNYQVDVALRDILLSPQFREIRGRDVVNEDAH
ncbi:DUF1592 domain-containing protein [Planctomicrobium sp. SH661]|uniref:DUF1592 domain-containing protein n=1 Tax=Planctomicrobium sp. SH661 TaxID=3448124 RepID=UPI003F5B3EF3